MTAHPTRRRDDGDITFSPAAWIAVDVVALGILVMLLWIFQPEKGLLPEPSWLVDPLVGWLIGNVLGFFGYKAFTRVPPAAVAAACLVLVAFSPLVFIKYPALGAFCAGLVIGAGASALVHRARVEHGV